MPWCSTAPAPTCLARWRSFLESFFFVLFALKRERSEESRGFLWGPGTRARDRAHREGRGPQLGNEPSISDA